MFLRPQGFSFSKHVVWVYMNQDYLFLCSLSLKLKYSILTILAFFFNRIPSCTISSKMLPNLPLTLLTQKPLMQWVTVRPATDVSKLVSDASYTLILPLKSLTLCHWFIKISLFLFDGQTITADFGLDLQHMWGKKTQK